MRKLKLQVQLSVDGYIAGPNGEMDWMIWQWDDSLRAYINAITEPVDTIILGRKLAEGFIPAWTLRLENPETADEFARKMVETPKVVFTKTLDQSTWASTELATGDLIDEITRRKQQVGKDLIVYGGGRFVSALLKAGLIDDFHLFINPVALGSGMPIFSDLPQRQRLTLLKAQAFDCGITVLHYVKQ